MLDYEVSDDDDSFENKLPCSQNNTPAKPKKQMSGSSDVVLISEDDEERLIDEASNEIEQLGLHQEGSEFVSQQRTFSAPSSRYDGNVETVEISDDESLITDDSLNNTSDVKENVSAKSIQHIVENKVEIEPSVNKSVDVRYISGVKVHFPVKPYSSQISIMSKVITGINKEQNCLLESPTGSGKTLALLCAALAWQQKQYDNLAKTTSERMGLSLGLRPPTPVKKNGSEAEDILKKRSFGHSSIYDEANEDSSRIVGKKSEWNQSSESENNESENLVTIHKRRKVQQSDGLDPGYSKLASKEVNIPRDEQLPGCSTPNNKDQQFRTSSPVTPKKSGIETVPPETPESVRNVNAMMRLLTFELLVDSRVPVIYYGARTHKQLQQVVKELRRTAYADSVTMSVLSSREHSCIHTLDRSKYANKNEMCRTLLAPAKEESESQQSRSQRAVKESCHYFEGVDRLGSSQALPRVWDLEELVTSARRLDACAYYAARRRATTARLVFCPYNYLIDPNIRSSLSIDLEGQIIILDEAHNIEDVCREIATITMQQEDFLKALHEMELVERYNPKHEESARDIIHMLKNFVDWFDNNRALLDEKPMSSLEVAHTWRPADFVETLTNHNIGLQRYPAFRRAANKITSILKEAPKTLSMVTTSTGRLLETLNTTLGYLFGEECRYMDDFKPVLVRTWSSGSEPPPSEMGWRSTFSSQRSQKQSYALRLLCMNPGVIFASLQTSRCIVLSSGTLAPVVSLGSELQASFPLQLAAKHVIPPDRVWVGSIQTCPKGNQLSCTYKNMGADFMLDGLGDILLWVCKVTPHGVLCFLPSYRLMENLYRKWELTGLWEKLSREKSVFMESRTMRDHDAIMTEFYACVGSPKGALLIAVYRGKVSEGMDFKDHQARAVVTVGIPFPNVTDVVVKSKMEYNDARRNTDLLSGSEWMRVQAYRALNQAVGRCVRHRADWGAVLLVDSRFADRHHTQYLSQWVQNFLGDNHHSWGSLTGPDDRALDSFMRRMTLQDEMDQHELEQRD